MKAILDPLIFWLPPNNQINQKYLDDILKNIDFVVSASRRGVQIATSDAVWQRVNRELVLPLKHHIEARHLFPRLQALHSVLTFVEPPLCDGETWGMRSLFTFGNLPDPEVWMTDTARLAAYWIGSNQEFVFLTRLILDRNLILHSSGNCAILEKTHWKVYISNAAGVVGNVGITCISSLRNLDVPWTTRYDDRLPDTAPANGLFFVPPTTWEKTTTNAVRTIRAKPAWVDAHGNGWADTSTPGVPHHWDVFLNENTLTARFGDDHVNITCWGTNDRGRVPGAVHH